MARDSRKGAIMSAHRSIRSVSTRFNILACTALGFAGCAQQSQTSCEHLATADDGHGLHVVNNVRLRALMDELKGLDFEKISVDLAAGRHAGGIDEAADSAVSLAADARMIPQVYKNLEMNDESRRVFDQLAVRLQKQCLQLREFALNRQIAGMQTKIKDIITTCNACHASIRGPTMTMIPEIEPPLWVGQFRNDP